jgi:predicted esterase
MLSWLLFLACKGQDFKSLTLPNETNLLYIIDSTQTTLGEPKNLVIALHWGWNRSDPLTNSHVKGFHETFTVPSVVLKNTIRVSIKCPYNGWDNEYSIMAIDELLNHLILNYNINESAMALIGYSAGGIGCWYYLQQSPNNIFKLVVPVAARPPATTINLETQSIQIVHGSNDDYFDIKKVRKFYSELKVFNEFSNLTVVPGAGHMTVAGYAPRVKNILSTLKYKYQ